MRLLVGWALEGFVINGMDVIEKKFQESTMTTIARMLECSFGKDKENQPLLILRKLENMTFNDVMLEGDWSVDKAKFFADEYRMTIGKNNVTCS